MRPDHSLNRIEEKTFLNWQKLFHTPDPEFVWMVEEGERALVALR